MDFSLKAPDGTVIAEYEMCNPVDEQDSDPEIRQMIEDSEKDIHQDEIYSTNDLIEAVKRGEL
ncbi:hypothetical protein [Paenibacillus odorifer]|uniref:Uncharacterized protein n=1 Tax=Paenibacillus odorifer TaxID=189426 RepID=A0A1R0XHW4_9BACL|nr:hypothetical protein [Paenibacillus odorifer]OMD34685.1 hypothetical protein BSK52_28830 [Paenibacillus odorifer]